MNWCSVHHRAAWKCESGRYGGILLPCIIMKIPLQVQITEIDNAFIVAIPEARQGNQVIRPGVTVACDTLDSAFNVIKQATDTKQDGEPANVLFVKPQSKLRTE